MSALFPLLAAQRLRDLCVFLRSMAVSLRSPLAVFLGGGCSSVCALPEGFRSPLRGWPPWLTRHTSDGVFVVLVQVLLVFSCVLCVGVGVGVVLLCVVSFLSWGGWFDHTTPWERGQGSTLDPPSRSRTQVSDLECAPLWFIWCVVLGVCGFGILFAIVQLVLLSSSCGFV